MHYMLDTNICIYIIREKPIKVLKKLCTYDLTDIVISAITHSELEYGVAKSSRQEVNREALIKFLAALEIVPYDDKASADYGQIRNHLEKKRRCRCYENVDRSPCAKYPRDPGYQ